MVNETGSGLRQFAGLRCPPPVSALWVRHAVCRFWNRGGSGRAQRPSSLLTTEWFSLAAPFSGEDRVIFEFSRETSDSTRGNGIAFIPVCPHPAEPFSLDAQHLCHWQWGSKKRPLNPLWNLGLCKPGTLHNGPPAGFAHGLGKPSGGIQSGCSENEL